MQADIGRAGAHRAAGAHDASDAAYEAAERLAEDAGLPELAAACRTLRAQA